MSIGVWIDVVFLYGKYLDTVNKYFKNDFTHFITGLATAPT